MSGDSPNSGGSIVSRVCRRNVKANRVGASDQAAHLRLLLQLRDETARVPSEISMASLSERVASAVVSSAVVFTVMKRQELAVLQYLDPHGFPASNLISTRSRSHGQALPRFRQKYDRVVYLSSPMTVKQEPFRETVSAIREAVKRGRL